MKRLVLAIALIFSLGSTPSEGAATISSKSGRVPAKTKVANSKSVPKGFLVTLTTYWALGGGADYWTKRFTSSTGQRLVDGVTVAADPQILPYGSIIDIEGVGRRVVKDTGVHVINRVASRKRGVDYPVIDLFFANRKEALLFARNHSPFAQVVVVRDDA